MYTASVPYSYWPNAVFTATYLINTMPSPNTNNTSPFELLHNRAPDYEYLAAPASHSHPLLSATNFNRNLNCACSWDTRISIRTISVQISKLTNYFCLTMLCLMKIVFPLLTTTLLNSIYLNNNYLTRYLQISLHRPLWFRKPMLVVTSLQPQQRHRFRYYHPPLIQNNLFQTILHLTIKILNH